MHLKMALDFLVEFLVPAPLMEQAAESFYPYTKSSHDFISFAGKILLQHQFGSPTLSSRIHESPHAAFLLVNNMYRFNGSRLVGCISTPFLLR